MEVQIQARNTRLSDGTRDYLTKKLDRRVAQFKS